MIHPSEPKHPKRNLLIAAAIYGGALLALCFLIHLEQLHKFFGGVNALLRPIVWGLILSYLVNPLFRFYERKLFSRLRYLGLRRTLSLICSYLTFFLLIALVLALILPQLLQSLTVFFSNLEDYVNTAISGYNSLVVSLNSRLDAAGIHQNLIKPLNTENIGFSMGALITNIDKIMVWAEPFLAPDGSLSIVELLSGLFSVITDLLFAFFVSIYLLSTKERRYAQIMKLRHAVFNSSTNEFITRVCTVANNCFGNFILGKLVESVLIFVTAYIAFLIFGIPYPLLIAVIGGIANIIPFVGPILGLIPALVIVLLAEPGKALTMVLIVLVIQQLDKNLINPRMFDQYNISSLAVLIAITTVGFAFGLPGLLLCVPLFATLIALLEQSIEQRLRKKGLLSATENYYPADSIVNPAKDVRRTSDTVIKSFERHILEIHIKQEKEQKLTRGERISLAVYDFLIRNRIISELSHEIRMQFTAESVAKTAEIETEQLIKQMHGIDLLEKSDSTQ